MSAQPPTQRRRRRHQRKRGVYETDAFFFINPTAPAPSADLPGLAHRSNLVF